jgi:selenocysteine lyase/cysteine desulfurase
MTGGAAQEWIMTNGTTDRRAFLKRFAVGAAAVSTAPAVGLRTAAFAEARTGNPDQEGHWRAVRDAFLLEPGYIYLNTAGLGPSPEPVLSAMEDSWRRLEASSETGHGERDQVREHAAAFLGCETDELAFTRSATEGMNLVARGLALSPGDEIVMTTHEHPGGAMPWFGVREDVDIRIRTVDPGGCGDAVLNRLADAMNERTRVVMVSHILCTTGAELPVRDLAQLCRARDVACVVDGAQAPGQIPVDLHALECDFYVASGHKWLLGPKETGFLYVRDEWLDRWRPSYVGAYSDDGFDLASGSFRRLRPASASEYGTRSTPLLRGLEAGIQFLETVGPDAVFQRGRSLAARLREGLEELPAVEILTPLACGHAILTFTLPASGGNQNEWVNRIRRDHGIRLRPVSEAGLSAVRASTHICNGGEEIDRLLEVLNTLV